MIFEAYLPALQWLGMHAYLLATVGVVAGAILLARGMARRSIRKDQRELEQWIVRALTGEERPVSPFLLREDILLPVLAQFDEGLRGDARWRHLRLHLLEGGLLKRARQEFCSPNWKKRHLAAQVFRLAPLGQDEHPIVQLLRDEMASVRVLAIDAATALHSDRITNVLLTCMSRTAGDQRQEYAEALLSGGEMAQRLVAERLERDKEQRIRIAALEVLSEGEPQEWIDLVLECSEAKQPELRIRAARALTRCPQAEGRRRLLHLAHDSCSPVRVAALEALGKTRATEAIPVLTDGLQDGDWWVRLKAAMALKNLGQEGIAILEAQEEGAPPEAQAIARYALGL